MEAWSLRRISDRLPELNLQTNGRTLNLVGGLALVALAISRRSLFATAALGVAGGSLLYKGATGRLPDVLARNVDRLRGNMTPLDTDSFGESRELEGTGLDDDDFDRAEASAIVAEGLSERNLDGLSRSAGARPDTLGTIDPIDLTIGLDSQETLDPTDRLDTSDPLDNAMRLSDSDEFGASIEEDDTSRTTPLDFSEDADETDRLGTIRRG